MLGLIHVSERAPPGAETVIFQEKWVNVMLPMPWLLSWSDIISNHGIDYARLFSSTKQDFNKLRVPY